MNASAKRVAARKCALTHEAVTRAAPRQRPYVIWDDKVTGLGLRVSPGGTKSFFVQCRTGAGRRTDANRKTTLERFPQLSPADARKRAQALIGAMRDGGDPSQARARARALPTLGESVEDWLRVKEAHVTASTLARCYRTRDLQGAPPVHSRLARYHALAECPVPQPSPAEVCAFEDAFHAARPAQE